jgi:RecB family exonuclease
VLAAPRRRRAPVLEGAAEADARAVAALGTAAAELAELGETLDGEELIELLETLTFDEPTTAEERVLIAEPLGIRARRFKAVFVCGLCDRELPRPSAPEPFLSDAARAELARASGLRLAAHEEWLESERFLFYTSVSRATERLVLSYRSSDEDGNLVLPSPFLADVRALLGEDWFARRRRRLLAEVTFPPADAPTERERRRAQAACSGAAAAGAARATGAVAAPERVLGPRAMAHVRHREVVSAGALEAFADCPVAWLVDAQLAPAALEPEPEPLVRGTVVHDVLEATLRRLGGPLTPASLPAARRLLDEALDGLAAERGESLAPGRSEALRAAVVRGIRADLHRYLSHEAASGRGFRPRALELRFGFDGEPDSLPALELGDDGDPVRLRGVIDRVDADPGGTGAAMVIDYKSGATRPEHQAVRWRSEHRLQVGLYMLVVRDLLGLDPVAGVYQPLRGRELRPRGVHSTHAELGDGLFSSDAREPDELGELLDGVRADAAAIAARLREGVLEPCPQTCSRDGCRYPGICRSS